MPQPNQQQSKFIPSLVMAIGSSMVLRNSGLPNFHTPEIDAVAAAALFFLFMSGCVLLGEAFRIVGGLFDILRARTPKGLKGTAGWVKHRWQYGRDLILFGWGPYWGTLRHKPIFADYESVALTIGPPGSGKSVGVVEPMALGIHESKIIPDFKGNLGVILGDALRKRGEEVVEINLGDVFSDEYGPSAKYNPFCLVCDNYWKSGGLRDVADDLAELAFQLIPEKDGISIENKYFRDGPRDLIEFAALVTTLIKGDNATLGDVARMLNDRQSLLWHALWAAGRLPIVEETGA